MSVQLENSLNSPILYKDYGYWLSETKLSYLEKTHNAKFIGQWFLRDQTGAFDGRYDQPMDFSIL